MAGEASEAVARRAARPPIRFPGHVDPWGPYAPRGKFTFGHSTYSWPLASSSVPGAGGGGAAGASVGAAGARVSRMKVAGLGPPFVEPQPFCFTTCLKVSFTTAARRMKFWSLP